MERGYLALYRKIQDHPFYKERREFSKLEAWIDILMEAQHSKEPKEVSFGMDILICNYGESLKSLRTWAIRWGWSPTKVKRFFELLKKLKQVLSKNETITTRLTVLNYYKYDPKCNANETRPKHDRNTTETRPLTDKNDKNVKHYKNKRKKKKEKPFIPPSIEDVKKFFHEKKYREDIAIKAFDYYSNQNPPWTDTNGKKVKSWKSKMIAVWFKPESKIQGQSNEDKKAEMERCRNISTKDLKIMSQTGNIYAFEILRERGEAIDK